MSIILGIDPGTTDLGFAVVKKEAGKIEVLDYGVCKTTPNTRQATKLLEISKDLAEIVSQYSVDACGIEKLFFATNTKTAIDVAQGRGVVLLEMEKKAIPITELSPPQVKKGICGNGRADKKQIQRALQLILKLDEIPKPDDAADALAIAYITALSI